MSPLSNHVAVLVLGDVGRSPRMQYHCTSLANLEDTQVHLIGYRGEKCIAAVEESPNIKQHLITTPFTTWSRKWFLFYAPLKVLYQLWCLFYILLFQIPNPRAILVQNPPSIPSLLAVWLACRLRNSKMIIDWHNFGYTVLSLNLSPSHFLVRLSKLYEAWFARRADAHLCVTEAMKNWLKTNWGVNAIVLYDKPPPFFKRTSVAIKHDLFSRLSKDLPSPSSSVSTTIPSTTTSSSLSSSSPTSTLFTELSTGNHSEPQMRNDRPAFIISSTSWTEDEDFGILLEALIEYDKVTTNNTTIAKQYPDIVVIVTGKGPLRSMYEQRIKELSLKRIHIRTLWLAASDYPLLVGAADLGVCLHFSTSGLDLPMKVVDMFGAGTPVAAIKYSCLHELVKHNYNGYVFTNSQELSKQLLTMFQGFPNNPFLNENNRLREGVKEFQNIRWQDNWDTYAAPLFRKR